MSASEHQVMSPVTGSSLDTGSMPSVGDKEKASDKGSKQSSPTVSREGLTVSNINIDKGINNTENSTTRKEGSNQGKTGEDVGRPKESFRRQAEGKDSSDRKALGGQHATLLQSADERVQSLGWQQHKIYEIKRNSEFSSAGEDPVQQIATPTRPSASFVMEI
ncbi:MAG: hypothetical protein CYPHOPRED_004841 [Cyphobasidiales sp. Tagirdzhanova-0007]|nr:MAG: hypothetical protein CYPHOPRED_004841 [Cyphobasidiales sp. Tagirdzhanova-0007]